MNDLKLLAYFSAATVMTETGCLEWTSGKTRGGYGTVKVNSKSRRAHRVAWELANGPIASGLNVLHHCDNPPCCQTEPTEGYPDGHLFLGTQADNVADMLAKGRSRGWDITHCPQRHEYSEANTRVNTAGSRVCLVCETARFVARKLARRLGPPRVLTDAQREAGRISDRTYYAANREQILVRRKAIRDRENGVA